MFIMMEPVTKVVGKMISKKVMEKKGGRMELFIKVSILKAKKKAKVSSVGQMGPVIKVLLAII